MYDPAVALGRSISKSVVESFSNLKVMVVFELVVTVCADKLTRYTPAVFTVIVPSDVESSRSPVGPN